MTYPDESVIETLLANAVPLQFDNTVKENFQMLHKLHHIWTPDIRVLNHNGDELYRWDGFLPPAEFTPRMICAFAMANLRSKRFDAAQRLYVDVLRSFSTSYAAPEAQYYLGVARYRNDPEGDDLLAQWANLRSRYPASEYRVKQSFKELPE
ncbi:MAG TPA: tetratricopeptide repeat protein [Candidatus Acidoferrales bacterium]|nr:tetratricopeptide repeat protein [Candidatus Acidoferrales bacterium]